MKNRKIVWLFAVLALASLAGYAYAGGNVNNQTAQSVMFATTTNGATFIMTDTQVYQYQKDVAATYFINAWDGVTPTGQIQGHAHGTTAPPAPPAPVPDDNKINGSVNGNQCTFFAGGTITAKGDTTYSQTVSIKVPVISGRGLDTYKYTYNYTVTVNQDKAPGGVVAPLTAWEMVSETPGGPVTVTLNGFLASQATVKKSGTASAPWTFKTDHTLGTAIDPNTGLTYSTTIQNLTATLTTTDPDGNVITLAIQPLTYTVVKGVDFYYAQNAGNAGPSDNLVNGGQVSDIHKGYVNAPDGITYDNFAGNDAMLGDQAVLDPASFTIDAPGNYTLTITGIMRGIPGVKELPIKVSESIIYTTLGDLCPSITVTP